MDYSSAKELPSRLFSGGHIRSPVSLRALGECNAIRSWGFGHSKLTFVGSFENRLRASQKLFLDNSFGKHLRKI